MTHGDPRRGGRHGDAGLAIGRTSMKPVTDFIDHAVEEGKPFLVWYAPFLPHTPHNPPKRLLDKYTKAGRAADVAKYYAMCEWFDETCGSLLAALDQRELRENTIIVYVCDNGWQARPDSGIPLPKGWWPGYAPKSKGSPYELGIRTPIFFSFPGVLEPERRESFASSIDLFPTILSLCGFEAPDSVAGMDLTKKEREEVIGAAYSIHNMTPGSPFETLQYSWVRKGDWKFLQRHNGLDTTRYRTVQEWDTVPTQLFHLGEDPDEMTNVADQHPELVREFQTTLKPIFPQPAP
jgi:arylsulfatase A-like enzyme